MVEGPTVKWLIDHHYLAPFTLYGYNADTSMLKKSSTGDYTTKSMDDFASHIIYGDVIKEWREKVDGQKTIVYCHSIEFSKQVAQAFNEAGIPAMHADSKTPAAERDQIMNDFKNGKITVLCNVDLISEGFNVPDCSCVVMLRPTQSLVLYIQQSMRCMRYKPGKQATIIDHVSNYENFGLPDADREWKLEDRNKKKGGGGGQSTRTCDKCFAVIPISCRTCPVCGAELETESTELINDKAVHLTEIKNFKPLTTNYLVTKKPAELNSMQELYAYAEAKGYKRGWAWYQGKQRGWVK